MAAQQDSASGKPSLDVDPSSDTSKILLAIQNLQSNTTAQIQNLTTRIDTLERDIADGSEQGDSSKNIPTVPSFTSRLAATTPSLPAATTPSFQSTTPSSFQTFSDHNSAKHHLVHESDSDTAKRHKTNNPSDVKSSKKHRHKKKSVPSDSELSSSDNDTHLDEQMIELMNEYAGSKPKYLEDPTTSDIPQPLADILRTWFWSIYSKEEVKVELAKPLRPANATALIPTKINEAVFRSLSTPAIIKDMPTRFIQNAFMKSSQSFATVWSTLITLENHLKATNQPLQVAASDTLTVDFLQLRKMMDQGLRLLGIANSQMVVHRKDILSQFLHKDFKKLCKSHVPFDQWMFGTNLKTLLEDTIRVNRMVQQNRPPQKSQKPSFSRGRGGHPAPRRGSFTNQGYQQGRGKGFAKGWQQGNNTHNPHLMKKAGKSQNQQQTQKS